MKVKENTTKIVNFVVKIYVHVELGDFIKYYDDSDDEGDDKDEVDLYLSTKIQKDENFDILEWWKDYQHVYPRLLRLAAYYLSILCSSAPSEREFSAAGLTINEHYSSLIRNFFHNLGSG